MYLFVRLVCFLSVLLLTVQLNSTSKENNYQTDPYSDGDPGQAIASRFDLRTSNAFAFGAIDTKVR